MTRAEDEEMAACLRRLKVAVVAGVKATAEVERCTLELAALMDACGLPISADLRAELLETVGQSKRLSH